MFESVDLKYFCLNPNPRNYGKRPFSVIAPTLWNNLPVDIRTTACLSSLKTRVKTFLFSRCF